VTTATVNIGGPGACGSEGGDPPVLNDGTPASASLLFTYDAGSGRLRLEVTNTSPLVANAFTPLITQVCFNMPRGAVTGIVLTGQSGSGGATPSFVPSYDLDLETPPNPNTPGPFGAFNVCLLTPDGIIGGIANGAATLIPGPPGRAVLGPATFAFQLQGPSLGQLTASAFANAGSLGGSVCTFLQGVAKFQGGGRNANGSAWIGDVEDCSPSAFLIGEPCLGNRITFTMAGAPGCAGCLLLTANPTPLPFLGYLIPAGPPYIDLFGGPIGANGARTLTVRVPKAPRLVGQTLYYFAVVEDAGRLVFTPRHSLTFCP
jgi:hypothetical protein